MSAVAPPIALSIGDPAGIGPEIAAMAWARRREIGLAPFAVIGDAATLDAALSRLGHPGRAVETTPEEAAGLFAEWLPVIAIPLPAPVVPGKPDPANAAHVIGAIETAVGLVHAGRARALATNPIAKSVLYGAGFGFPGHTEFLGALAERLWSAPATPVMMLWCDRLAVVPATVHIPLAAVPAALTTQLIVETGRIVARDLRRRFGVAAPRLAVTGLNPHAGESGTLGLEDDAVIRPAIAQLQAEGIAATGPHPADALFAPAARSGYDAALAMYHDQALIPIKTLAFDEAVNVTLGLPFIRVSPDHGTAFDIAGRGLARPDSLIAALRLADRLAA